MQPRRLALAHDDAARELGEIFGGADPGEQPFHLAEPALAVEALGIVRKLLQRFDVGRDPGKSVGRVLLALERVSVDLAAGRDFGRDALDGASAQRGGGFSALGKEGNEVGGGPRTLSGRGFGDSHGSNSWL